MTNDLGRLARNRSHPHELHGGALPRCAGNDGRSASASRYTTTERPGSRCSSARRGAQRCHGRCQRPTDAVVSDSPEATWGMSDSYAITGGGNCQIQQRSNCRGSRDHPDVRSEGGRSYCSGSIDQTKKIIAHINGMQARGGSARGTAPLLCRIYPRAVTPPGRPPPAR